MIIVKNRELLIPGPERYIGTTYDTESENRQFLLSRFAQNGVDLSALTFHLDLKYANDATDTVLLDKEVTDTNIILTWDIGSSVLQVPGTLFIQLRAADDEVTVKWSSFHAALYVERHLNTPGTYTGSLTEIEQIEQDHQYMKRVVDELKANIDYAHDAEAWAQGTRSGTAVPSTDKTYHKNSKYYSEQASAKATQAANSATAAANSATQAAETVSDTNTRFNNAMAAVTSETEVIDARVGADGTQHTVLKDRLDAEHTQLKNAISQQEYALKDWDIPLNDFVKGSLGTDGSVTTDAKKIVGKNYLKFDIDVALVNDMGMIVCLYADDFTLSKRTVVSPGNNYVVPANTYFRYTINFSENVTDPKDINNLSHVLITNVDKIKMLQSIDYSIVKNNGEGITLSTPFIRGNLNTSGKYESNSGRIVTPQYLVFDKEVTLYLNDVGVVLCTYDASYELTSRTSSTGSVTIPANTIFKLAAYRNETGSTPIEETQKRIIIKNPLIESLERAEENIDFDFLRCFHNITGIGDSLMAGYTSIDGTTVSSATARAAKNNWFAYLCSSVNRDGTNLAVGSSTMHNWRYADQSEQPSDINNANIPTDCYLFGLGVNDIIHDLPIGSASDIDASDINNCGDTVYGNLYYLLSKLKVFNPYAKIFVFTIPKYGAYDVTAVNTAISAVCAMLSNVYCITLPASKFDIPFLNANFTNNHYNPISYNYMAKIVGHEINQYIFDNYTDFKWIPYEH